MTPLQFEQSHQEEWQELQGLLAQLQKSVRGHARGDLFCRVVVETPVNLSHEQRKLVHDLDDSLRNDGNKHAPRQKSFLEGVKRFFSGSSS